MTYANKSVADLTSCVDREIETLVDSLGACKYPDGESVGRNSLVFTAREAVMLELVILLDFGGRQPYGSTAMSLAFDRAFSSAIAKLYCYAENVPAIVSRDVMKVAKIAAERLA